jgi:hypothetical protein
MMAKDDGMFSTTLRLDDDLGRFLREAAEAQAVSVNGWLAELLRREQAAAARRKLAADWEAYGKDVEAQDVAYAFTAQAEAAAEPRRRSYRARKPK